MPPKEPKAKKKRAPSIKQKLVADLRTRKKKLKTELTQVERDLRSLNGRKKQNR
jgi:hypothetical protein